MVHGVTYSSAALAERFGTSATPVREAMLDLIKEGMVVAMPNKGFRVVLPDQRELAEMKEMLLLLEVPTAGRIAGSVGRDQVAQLRTQANRVAAAARAADVADYIEGDREFHHDLLALAGNARLVEVVDQLRTRTWLYARQGLLGEAGGLVQSAAEHLELVKAIGARDRREAQRLMKQHLGHSHTAGQAT